MAISPDRTIELNLKQKVAVAQSRYRARGGRGELVLSELPQAPAGIEPGVTTFKEDDLKGIQKIYTWEGIKCHEIFMLGPIKNADRKRIAEELGFNTGHVQPLDVTERVGPFYISRNYLTAEKNERR